MVQLRALVTAGRALRLAMARYKRVFHIIALKQEGIKIKFKYLINGIDSVFLLLRSGIRSVDIQAR